MCFGMFLFVFLSCFGKIIAVCPPEFLNACKCGYVRYNYERTFITNCTNTGFDNTLMLRKMSPLTEVLIFVGNEVKDLPLNIFGQDTVYEKLHTIDFSNNHIQTVKGRTFHNVANVTKLILNDNDLYIVSKDHHPRMFSNFVNLRELHLKNAFTEKVKSGDYLNNLVEVFGNSSLKNLRVLNMESNEITGMDHKEFCFLPALEELYMSNNRLKEFSVNFTCLNHIKLLDVSHNLITTVNDSTIQSLDLRRSLRLNLSANPFKCDCDFINTYEWMKTTSLHLIKRENYYCYDGYPSNIGQTVISINIEDLQCLSHKIPTDYHSTRFIVLAIGLLCICLAVTAILYKNKTKVANRLRLIFHPIRSKFNYVSLERRESSMEV